MILLPPNEGSQFRAPHVALLAGHKRDSPFHTPGFLERITDWILERAGG